MNIRGASFLIIGGTGSIGKTLISNLLKQSAKSIRLFSRDEYKLSETKKLFVSEHAKLEYMVGDVRDRQSVAHAMKGIDYVFHLAALKQIETGESYPLEVVKTNVMGTSYVIEEAVFAKVKKVIFSSTDKAVFPTTAYGATKLLAERIVQSTASYTNIRSDVTKFAIVRFGNVMFSRGSVIPAFIEQCINENKIKLTDVRMSRFMMTKEHAASLLLNSMKIAEGGEILIWKMPVVKVKDLADVVLDIILERRSNLKNNISIIETGIRSGEKLFEELLTSQEAELAYENNEMFLLPSPHNSSFVPAGFIECNQKSYRSDKQMFINKEEIKTWILEDVVELLRRYK